MPIYHIANFSSGLDLRRSAITSPAGTLRVLEDCHITDGGEIEKREAFVEVGDLPAESTGLAALGDQFFTFVKTGGSTTSPDPAQLTVQTLNTTDDLLSLHDYDVFDNKLYLSMRTSAKEVQHFYDGQPVSDVNAVGRVIRTYRSKVHSISYKGSDLQFSALGDPTDWTGVGSGFINIASEDADSAQLIGLDAYYGRLAAMSNRSTTIWQVDPDPQLYSQEQILRQAGTVSSRSLKGIGAGDVLYVADTGVRSLRARDSSNAAGVSDIGSPIDVAVQALLKTITTDDSRETITSLIEPLTGRFFVCFPDRAYVLSYFPSPDITAWSQYNFPFTHAYSAQSGEVLGFRGTNNKFYVLGGGSGTPVYDSTAASVWFPYLSLDIPGQNKQFRSFDLSCEGQWQVQAAFDPGAEAAVDNIAIIDGPTYLKGTLPMQGTSTHVQMRFTSIGSTAAKISDAIIYYDLAEVL